LPLLTGDGKLKELLKNNFKNVQKLSHLKENDYYEVMNFFVASIGAKNCFTCHTLQDFSSDELPEKNRAREMIGMVQEINQKFFKEERLTCYTCHRGNPFPQQVPEAWAPGW